MPIISEKNLFPGINPLLNSDLQQPGSIWGMFHSRYIGRIFDAIEPLLPDNYYVTEETSLQAGAYFEETFVSASHPVPDISIYSTGAGGTQTTSLNPEPTLTFPVTEAFMEEQEMMSVVIYKIADKTGDGKPVTHIELLSRSNKPGSSHYEQYLTKRQQLLQSGRRLRDGLRLNHSMRYNQ